MRSRRLTSWWFVGVVAGSLLVAAGVRAAPESTLNLVPADDVALAVTVLAARGTQEPVLLVDPRDAVAVDGFLSAWRGPVRCFRSPQAGRSVSAAMQAAAGNPCSRVDDIVAFSRSLRPEARVAIATTVGAGTRSEYAWLLRAAAFAGVTDAALLPLPVDTRPGAEALDAWDLDLLYLTRPAASWRAAARGIATTVVDVSTPDDLFSELSKTQASPPTIIVIANPKDRESPFSPSSLSLLAPLVSAVHRAPLLLTTSGSDPQAVERDVLGFLDRHRLSPSHVVLVGDELGLRSHRVQDPVLAAGGPEALGGGKEVRVELFSGVHRGEAQDFPVGRIVAESAAQASVLLARQYHPGDKRGRPVVFLANADGVFQLGEAISRATTAELRNVGVPVRAYYGSEITEPLVQRTLAETDLLVWEGHARDLTLEERGGIAATAAPEVVVLQGCHTFDRSDPFILMDYGTIAAIGTSTAVYSAPGSAFARALFDALLYDGADLGTAARNARNFLFALAELQQARRHTEWTKTLRAALAFGLWGDPTHRPRVRPERPKLPAVRWKLGENAISLTIPARTLRAIKVGPYRVESPPRVMFGGLLIREKASRERRIKDLYFTVQRVPASFKTVCSPGKGWSTISLYAPRSETIYLLARPDWDTIGRSPSGGPYVFPLAPDPESCHPRGDGHGLRRRTAEPLPRG